MQIISIASAQKMQFLLVTMLALIGTSCWQNSVSAQAPQRLPPAHPIDLSRYIFPAFGYDAAIVGLLSKDTLLTARYGFDSRSTLDFWDVKTGQVKDRIITPSPVASNSVVVSPDGLELMATQNIATDIAKPIYFPHTIFLWQLRTRKLIATLDLSGTNRIEGAFFVPNDPDRLLVTTHIPSQFLSVSLKKKSVSNIVKYQYATYLQQDYVAFSPDGKLLVGLYMPDESQPSGSFDVFDAKNLKIITSFDGDKIGRVVSLPLFFISNNKIILGNTLYNTHTMKSSLVLPHYSNLHGRCLSAVPGHQGYAIFLVKHEGSEINLELWDIPHEKVLHRWLLPRRPRLLPLQKGESGDNTEAVVPVTAYVSRDSKAFGFLDDRGVVRVYDYNFQSLPPVTMR